MKSSARQRSGFTVPELLAAVTAICLVSLLAFPAAGSDRRNGRATVCLANMRHLASAWQLYAFENNELFAHNFTGGEATGGAAANRPTSAPWALGWLDWGTSTRDNTNMALIREERYARISPYINTERNAHKCPADVYASGAQRARGIERVRSVAMNAPVGDGNVELGPLDPGFVKVRGYADLSRIQPTPGQLYTVLDEHPDSINDPVFYPPRLSGWIDWPAAFHDGAGSFAFADGHAELRLWRGSARNMPVKFSSLTPPIRPNDPDVLWARQNSTLRPGVQ